MNTINDVSVTDYNKKMMSTTLSMCPCLFIGSHGKVQTPKEGKTGSLDHSRMGFVGWITYWSLRETNTEIVMIMKTSDTVHNCTCTARAVV